MPSKCPTRPQRDADDSCEKHILYIPSRPLYKTKDFGISSDANSTARRLSATDKYFFVTAETVAVSASNIPTISRVRMF